MLLNLKPEEVLIVNAAMELAKLALGGYTVRTSHSREVLSQHIDEFLVLHGKVKGLEARREIGMAHAPGKGKKYLHVAISEDVHRALCEHLLKQGGGKIRTGSVGDFVEAAVRDKLPKAEDRRTGTEG